MKITLVDGSLLHETDQQFTTNLAIELSKQGHQIYLFRLAEKHVKYCNGCWTCWWKTPGICVHHDDMPELLRNYLQSDLVLHYSPLAMGFISSQLKTVNDRSIPLVHPYGELVQGECHHRARYDTYPLLGLIVDPQNDDKEDLQITKILYERMALNLKTRIALFSTSLRPLDDLVYEIALLEQAQLKKSPQKHSNKYLAV